MSTSVSKSSVAKYCEVCSDQAPKEFVEIKQNAGCFACILCVNELKELKEFRSKNSCNRKLPESTQCKLCGGGEKEDKETTFTYVALGEWMCNGCIENITE